jgi:glutamyl-tRNA synthetase
VVKSAFSTAGTSIEDEARLKEVIDLIKERCTLIPDFITEGRLFFVAPEQWDLNAIKPKWSVEKKEFFALYIEKINALSNWTGVNLESAFKELAEVKKLKPGDLLLPMRIMLVGEKKGPPVFEIATLLGKEETIGRMKRLIGLLSDDR